MIFFKIYSAFRVELVMGKKDLTLRPTVVLDLELRPIVFFACEQEFPSGSHERTP